MSAQLLINGKPIAGATHFGYDGCHKVYLIRDENEREIMESNGYDIFPIELLPRVWRETCPLRFISPADLSEPNFVEQCDEATVEVRS